MSVLLRRGAGLMSARPSFRRMMSRMKLVDVSDVEEETDPAVLKAEEQQFDVLYAQLVAEEQEESVVTAPSLRRTGVIGQKIGMMSIFDAYGQQRPVTIVRIEDCHVVQVKDQKNSKGLIGIQVGAGTKKQKRSTKALRNHCAAVGLPPKMKLVEFATSAEAVVPPGTPLSAMHFIPGQLVDVRGQTNGKGFAGVMKRYGFKGQSASHGTSKTHRHMGSTGGCQDPGKVWKGKKMPGRMGGNNVTSQNMAILRIDPVRSLLYIEGSLPGRKGNWVTVRDAIKRPKQVELLPMPTHFPSDKDPKEDLLATIEAPNPFFE